MNEILLGNADLSFWVTVFVACLLGAMSPGQVGGSGKSYSGKRADGGFLGGNKHGFAIMLYAAITTFGLSAVISNYQQIFDIIQVIGCLFLLFFGVSVACSETHVDEVIVPSKALSSNVLAIRDGLAIALFNPKILIFFTALFSQFVRLDSSVGEKMALALIAGGVDIALVFVGGHNHFSLWVYPAFSKG